MTFGKLDQQERHTTRSLFSHTRAKVRPREIQYRKTSLTRGHSHAHGDECPERHEQVPDVTSHSTDLFIITLYEYVVHLCVGCCARALCVSPHK